MPNSNLNNSYRFSREELEQQKTDLLFYIINELSEPTIDSLQESIKEIKELTGLEISLNQAMQIKRLDILTKSSEEEIKSRGK